MKNGLIINKIIGKNIKYFWYYKVLMILIFFLNLVKFKIFYICIIVNKCVFVEWYCYIVNFE